MKMQTYNKALLQTHSVYRTDPYPPGAGEVLTKGEKERGPFPLSRSHFSSNEIKFNLTQFTVSSTFISLLHFGRSNFP
jgi:hypothetical protein